MAAPMAAPVDVGDPVAVLTDRLPCRSLIAGDCRCFWALMPTLWTWMPLDFGLSGLDISRRRLGRLGARADALEKMRLFRPAQWIKLVGQEAESERKMSLDSRLPIEIWTAFFSELVNHQANILTDGDFRDWQTWIQDLVIARYPMMAR